MITYDSDFLLTGSRSVLFVSGARVRGEARYFHESFLGEPPTHYPKESSDEFINAIDEHGRVVLDLLATAGNNDFNRGFLKGVGIKTAADAVVAVLKGARPTDEDAGWQPAEVTALLAKLADKLCAMKTSLLKECSEALGAYYTRTIPSLASTANPVHCVFEISRLMYQCGAVYNDTEKAVVNARDPTEFGFTTLTTDEIRALTGVAVFDNMSKETLKTCMAGRIDIRTVGVGPRRLRRLVCSRPCEPEAVLG